MHLRILSGPWRRPLVLLTAIVLGGSIVLGCPSKDSTSPNYEPPPAGAPQP